MVAELLTTGYGLNVRAAQAHTLDDLERELQLEVAESAVAAGVGVTRDGENATAATTILLFRLLRYVFRKGEVRP